MTTPRESLVRWRLVLGADAEQGLGCGLDGEDAARDAALDFLYAREYGSQRNTRKPATRAGTLDHSELTVPDWINRVNELFPKRTIERLERDALERYQLQEMVTNPELLARAQPSVTLLKAVLHTKHLMNQQVLTLARDLVRRVVEQLLEKIARPVQSVFLGAANRQRRSFQKVAKNFDPRATVRRNLAHFDPENQRLVIRTPLFHSRVRRQSDRWQIIIVVDQSGSMVDSVIHAAVTASVFWGVKSLKPHLVAFDTNIVDLTSDCVDPVETLMKVQLGGGTDIGSALAYAASLVENPRRAIVVLVTDFFEGAPVGRLFAVTKHLVESGATLLGLAALDADANPTYDRATAQTMADLGAHVGAMTPGELAEWVAARVK